MWRTQEGATLSHGSHRRRMDSLGTAHARGQTWWSPAHDRYARGGQGYLLRPAGRLPMAPAPERVSALPDRLSLFLDVAPGRRLGADARQPPWRRTRGRGPHA